MMPMVKIAILHARCLPIPAEAQPSSADFTEEAAWRYVRNNVVKTLEMLETAAASKPDLICTNEDFANTGAYLRDFRYPALFATVVEKSAQMIAEGVSRIAKAHAVCIASNAAEPDGGALYNVSTLYGKDGKSIGKYKKVHLADTERWRLTAGEAFPVFNTHFGRIGFATCYDMTFPETCRALALNGADIIVHQTQGWGLGARTDAAIGDALLRIRAAENGVFIVVGKNIQGDGGDGGRSCVIDNNGQFIAESGINDEGILLADIEADYDAMDTYLFNNYFTGISSTKARQFAGRFPRLYGVFASESTALGERYKGCKPRNTQEQYIKVMADWEQKSEDEKERYHW